MIIRAQIDGRSYTFNTEDEDQIIGEGGEAVVMKWTPSSEFTRRHGNGKYAVKIFFMESDEQRAAAVQRQTKLRHTPKGVPRNVVTPLVFVVNSHGQIIGFVMRLLEDVVPLSKFMDPEFRKERRITQAIAVQVLIRLHATVIGLHQAGVVIGDFNDKNVLVNLKTFDVYIIDFDSAQWGQWTCLTATPEFSDPTLLDQSHNLRKGASYSRVSDWYSFAVIVYQLLTLSHPYRDGVHRPGSGHPRKRFPERVTLRLSVFDPRVHLDASTHHPATLPDELGRLMGVIFIRDHRPNPFPIHLLTTFQWMRCPRCGREHGRSVCPTPGCQTPGVVPSRSTTTPPGTVFLTAAASGGRLQYVCSRNGAYYREDDAEVWRPPQGGASLSALIAGSRTILHSGTSFGVFNGDIKNARRYPTQNHYGRTTVAANSRHFYWVSESSLVRDDGRGGIVTIGPVAPHMTSVWAGERFGLAMVQAGVVTKILTFDAERPGYRSYLLPPEFGIVVDAQCIISDDLAWLTVSSRAKNGVTTNRCYVFDASARLRATAEERRGEQTWLGSMTPTAFAIRSWLFVPVTRIGIVRVALEVDSIRREGVYPRTADLMPNSTATVGLGLTQSGIMHVGRTSITQVATS